MFQISNIVNLKISTKANIPLEFTGIFEKEEIEDSAKNTGANIVETNAKEQCNLQQNRGRENIFEKCNPL